MDGYQAAKNYGKQMFGCDKAVLYDEALPAEDYVYFQSADENNPPTVEQNMQKIQVMSAVFAQTTTGTELLMSSCKMVNSLIHHQLGPFTSILNCLLGYLR
jgi:hypothetical protein